MDYLHYAIALAPLGIYWILTGYLYQRANPMLINAAQDALLFGLGASGLILIGPMELFFPNAAYALLGAWTWLFLLLLYGFIIMFIALNRKPQWTLYGANSMALRGILERVLEQEKIAHAWHGSILIVPELGIQAIVEPANLSDRAAQLSRCGRNQDISGWHRLERLVTTRLSREPSTRGGLPWIIVGLAMLAVSIGMFWMEIDQIMLAWEQL